MIEPTVLAWCAGLFDGEGSIFIQKIKVTDGRQFPQYTLYLRIKMTCRATIERFQKIFGMSPVTFCKATNERCKDSYVFQVTGKKAEQLAHQLIPYSFTKKKLLALAISYGKECTSISYTRFTMPARVRKARELHYQRCKAFNQ